jgi:hypothetical protein
MGIKEQFGPCWGAVMSVVVFGGTGWAAGRAHKPPEYPLYCAGIMVGVSPDDDVQRMYRRGLYVANEGHEGPHGGGRYYIDRRHRVTLHIVIGGNGTVESVSYRSGVHLPPEHQRKRTVPQTAVCTKLTTQEYVQGGIRLGDSSNVVLQQFGKPKKDTRRGTTRVLHYAADYETMPYVLDYEATFRFQNDHLIAVELYNGE